MTRADKIYHSYKHKNSVYYVTASEENKLLMMKKAFLMLLSPNQLTEFEKLEKCFNSYKESLTKEIIDYTINYRD